MWLAHLLHVELNWLESSMNELLIAVKKPMRFLIVNKFAINLAKNPISDGKSKQIETRFHN